MTLSPLPDLAAQVQEYLSSPENSTQTKILFTLSFGFWDIYHLASLDYELAQNMTDAAVGHLIYQINTLYSNYIETIYNRPETENPTASNPPPFRLIILRLFDPTLVPGWLSQRPVPPPPSTVAEQQKQAVYLTERWNSLLENALGLWVMDADAAGEANEIGVGARAEFPRKDIFYYDLPQHILDIIVEHQLEDAGQSDASGLGTGKSPFTSVSEPCLREGSAEQEGGGDGVRNTVCADPEACLFWDEFNVGGVANEEIGREVAEMIRRGRRMGG